MSLPISGYFIRNVDGDSKVGIKKCLSIMRICNVLTILCLIVLFSPCDSQPFLYAGGNVAYNDTKLDTGWIPSERNVVMFFLPKYFLLYGVLI